jgi:hypothetical protein
MHQNNHRFALHRHHYKHKNIEYRSIPDSATVSIFINQSDNINIVAKLGHTIHLPCLIYKTNDQSNVILIIIQKKIGFSN